MKSYPKPLYISPSRNRWNSLILAIVLGIMLGFLLSACGGGSDEEDNPPTVEIGPPDCVNHPERCK